MSSFKHQQSAEKMVELRRQLMHDNLCYNLNVQQEKRMMKNKEHQKIQKQKEEQYMRNQDKIIKERKNKQQIKNIERDTLRIEYDRQIKEKEEKKKKQKKDEQKYAQMQNEYYKQEEERRIGDILRIYNRKSFQAVLLDNEPKKESIKKRMITDPNQRYKNQYLSSPQPNSQFKKIRMLKNNKQLEIQPQQVYIQKNKQKNGKNMTNNDSLDCIVNKTTPMMAEDNKFVDKYSQTIDKLSK